MSSNPIESQRGINPSDEQFSRQPAQNNLREKKILSDKKVPIHTEDRIELSPSAQKLLELIKLQREKKKNHSFIDL